MNWIVALIAAGVSAAVAYATSDKKATDSMKFLRPASSTIEYDSRELSRRHRLVLTAVVFLLSGAAMLRVMERVSNPIGVCKMTVALLCMTGAAVVDYRERRIPNFFPGSMALVGIVLLMLGVLLGQQGAFLYITSGVVGCVASTLSLIAVSALTKQGIGAGDIKLIGALALIGGVNTVLGTIFFGLVSCSVAAVVLVARKKATWNASLPFGPFLFLGYIITLLAVNF